MDDENVVAAQSIQTVDWKPASEPTQGEASSWRALVCVTWCTRTERKQERNKSKDHLKLGCA